MTTLHPRVTLDGQPRQQQRPRPLPPAREGTRGRGGDSSLLTTSLARSKGAAWLSCYLSSPILKSKQPKKLIGLLGKQCQIPSAHLTSMARTERAADCQALWSPCVQQGSWPSSLLKVLGRSEVSSFGLSPFTTTLLFTFLTFACYVLPLVVSTHNISMPAGDETSCFA